MDTYTAFTRAVTALLALPAEQQRAHLEANLAGYDLRDPFPLPWRA